jgi:hypothetical protein
MQTNPLRVPPNLFEVAQSCPKSYLSSLRSKAFRTTQNRGSFSVAMSIMNPLPPQAYTKDTLVQAYAWLQGQGESIKELATTPDVLVSLYLKAKMQGNHALERPSIQNFKNELKNLAGMIGEFEIVESPNPSRANTADEAPSTVRMRSKFSTSQNQPPQQLPLQNSTVTSSSLFEQNHQHQSIDGQTLPGSKRTSQDLDSRSMDLIQEVKIQFNLSSDTEAMRMLIAVGYNQVKSLLK